MQKRQTFTNLQEWLREVEKHAKSNVSIIVIGNKSDASKDGANEVSEIDIAKFQKDNNLKVYYASAKTGDNVESSFLNLTSELI